MQLLLLLALIAATAVLTAVPWVRARTRAACSLIGGLASAATGMIIAWPVLAAGGARVSVDGLLVLDRFAAFTLTLIMAVYAGSTVASARYIRHERREGVITERQERLYDGLLHLFVLTMVAAALANNVAVLWIALEATTLSTTLLVAFRRTTGSIEAAWKYIVLCSTGITLGLLGVLMVSYAAQSSGVLQGGSAFLLTELHAHAAALAPATMRWAFVFLFIGIGTKVGIAPMHTWLPDAHSKTPSPISALLSGVLLNVACVVLIRFKFVTDAALGSPEWTNAMFLTFGAITIAIPAFILLSQRNYKRMLGYSSVEHMGIIAFAVGLGPFGLVPALMHMAGHAFAKPLLFLGAGEFLDRWKSTLMTDVRDAITVMPRTAAYFLLGALALLGVPPSALFMSEFLVVRYGISVHPVWTIVVLMLLTVTFIAMARSVIPMLYAKAGSDAPQRRSGEPWNAVHVVLALQLAAVMGLGVWFMSDGGSAFVQQLAHDVTAGV